MSKVENSVSSPQLSESQLSDQSASNDNIPWWQRPWRKSWWRQPHNRLVMIVAVTLLILLLLGLFILHQNSQNQSISLEESGSRHKILQKINHEATQFKDNVTTKLTSATPAAKPSPSPSPAPTPSPTPTTLIPDEGSKGNYNLSQSKRSGPTISQVSFDPLDAKQGQTLTITLKVKNNPPAQAITGTLQTDTSTEKLTFTKTKATNVEIWQAQLKLPATVLYKYILTVNAKSATGNSQIIVAPRS